MFPIYYPHRINDNVTSSVEVPLHATDARPLMGTDDSSEQPKAGTRSGRVVHNMATMLDDGRLSEEVFVLKWPHVCSLMSILHSWRQYHSRDGYLLSNSNTYA